eukprot:6470973-Amphidinium_carterae.1
MPEGLLDDLGVQSDLGKGMQDVASGTDFAVLNAKYMRAALSWVKQKPLAKVMLLRLCMFPLMSLLGDYLTRSGEEWQVKQLAEHCKQQAQGASNHVTTSFLEYIAQTSEQQFYTSLGELLVSDKWSKLPRQAHRKDFQNLSFRMLSRMGGLVWQLLYTPAKCCPYKLFRVLLQGQKGADAVHEVPICMRDKFTSHFLQVHPNLLSDDSLMCLRAIAAKHHVDTVQIEWGHGRVNRVLTHSSDTNCPSFQFLNARFVCQKHRDRWGQLVKRGCTSILEESQAGVDKEEPATAASVESVKPARGGGGAWRAYISAVKKGTKGKPLLKGMNAKYQQEKAKGSKEFQGWVAAGKAATIRHQHLKGGASFGPGRRHVVRAAAKMQSQALVEASHGHLDKVSFTALLDVGSDGKLQRNLKAELTHCGRLAFAQARFKKQEHLRELEYLKQGVAAIDSRGKEQLLGVVPGFKGSLSHVFCIPSSDFARYFILSNKDLQPLLAIASWALQFSRKSNVAAYLRQDWENRNLPILDTDVTLLDEESHEVSKCLHQGCCTCSEDSKHLKLLQNRLFSIIKSMVAGASGNKTLLSNGYVCMQLLPHKPSKPSNAWDSLLDEVVVSKVTEAECFSVEHTTWLHICLQYYRPFRPTFQYLREISASNGCTTLEFGHRWLTVWEVLQLLDLGVDWNVLFHETISSLAPCQLKPSQTEVKSLGLLQQLWPLPSKPKRKRGPKKKPCKKSKTQEAKGVVLESVGVDQFLPEDDMEHEPLGDFEGSNSEEPMQDGVDEDDGHELEELLERTVVALADEITLKEAHAMPGLETDLAQAEELASEAIESGLVVEIVAEEVNADPFPDAPFGSIDLLEHEASLPQRKGQTRRNAVSWGKTKKADISVDVAGGMMNGYKSSGIFTGVCKNPMHGKFVDSKAERWSKAHWPASHSTRAEHREVLSTIPGADELLEMERDMEPGEHLEPDMCP